jgi:hypothetical protein
MAECSVRGSWVTNVGEPTVAVMIASLTFAVILMIIGQTQVLFGFLMLNTSSDGGVGVCRPCCGVPQFGRLRTISSEL